MNKGIKLLVILDSDVIQEPEERARKNFEVMTENIGMDDYKRYNMSVVVQTRGDNEKDKQREDFFICEIEKTGKVIYEKYK